MKCLFTTNPGIGHLLPMLPFAHALRSADHEVLFAAARGFAPTIEERGFPAIAAGLDWLETKAAATFPEIAGMAPDAQGAWLLGDIFADVAAQRMVPDLMALCRSWQPDVLVRNDFEFGACIAGECLGIPYATVGVSFYLPPPVLEQLVGDQLVYLRSSFGLRPYPALDMLYRHLYLTCAPPAFQSLVLPTMCAIQPRPLVSPAELAPPAWWDTLPDQPTIYASMSSAYDVPTMFPTILAALRDEPVNLVLTVGRKQDPKAFGPQPPHIRIEQFIPQAALFPRCDLFITHNPLFTMMTALSHGLPLLMTPFGGELPSGAMRAAELGLGRVLRLAGDENPIYDAWVPTLSVGALRAAIRELLANPSYRAQAHKMQRAIQALPPPEHAVRLLERLADGQPHPSFTTGARLTQQPL